VLGVVGIHRSSQVFKPASRGLIRDGPVARVNAGSPIVVVCSAGRPVDKVATELGFNFADGLVAKEIVEVEQTNEQQIMLRPSAFVALILRPL
jgi:hypothetical protein